MVRLEPDYTPSFARDLKVLKKRHISLEPLERVAAFQRAGSHDELFR